MKRNKYRKKKKTWPYDCSKEKYLEIILRPTKFSLDKLFSWNNCCLPRGSVPSFCVDVIWNLNMQSRYSLIKDKKFETTSWISDMKYKQYIEEQKNIN